MHDTLNINLATVMLRWVPVAATASTVNKLEVSYNLCTRIQAITVIELKNTMIEFTHEIKLDQDLRRCNVQYMRVFISTIRSSALLYGHTFFLV